MTIVVHDPEALALLQAHRLGIPIEHDNLQPARCVCAPPPGLDGPTCSYCGGMTKRAGTCAVCVECASTTGCG